MKKQTDTVKASAMATPVEAAAMPVATKVVKPMSPKFMLKKSTIIRAGIIVLIALIAIPVLDWIIQTSVTSKYAAFYKNQDVTRSEYIKTLESQYGTTVLQQLLVRAAVYDAATKQGISTSEADVTAAIEAKKKAAGITTAEQFQAALDARGITEEQFRNSQRITVPLDKMLAPTMKEPTEAEAKSFYETNKAQYNGKKYEEVKTQAASDTKAANLSTEENSWVTTALQNYDAKNIIAGPTAPKYGFMRSLDLVMRLFSSNPNTK